MLQQTYYWAKKIHNWMMWLMILSGVPIALSGIIIEDTKEWLWLFSKDQLNLIRFIHGEWSSKFALILAVMMITGFLMWLLPRILRSQKLKK